MTDIFWPADGTNVWDQIKDQVEALIDQKIAEATYNRVEETLGVLTPTPTGLISYLVDYQNEIKYGTKDSILSAWKSAKGAFSGAQGYFQDPVDKVALLPLFAQFANMYLALLRDGVLKGKDWGRTDDEYTNIDVPALKDSIDACVAYTTTTYNTGHDAQEKSVPENDETNQPFQTYNKYDRLMSLAVLDYRDTWPYYNVSQYPNGATVSLTREIYTDPYGNTLKYVNGNVENNHPLSVPPFATQFPTQLTVWGGSRIDAVQLTYPAGGAPGGGTQTPRMGDSNGGSTKSPQGGIVPISLDNPIIQAFVTYDIAYENYPYGSNKDQVINTLQFMYNDGTYTSIMGGKAGQYQSGVIGFNYLALSSIYIPGVNDTYKNSADCVVFGFKYWNPPAATLRAISRLYVSSPKEYSAADFAKILSKRTIPANLITDALKVIRQARWAWIKAHARK